MFLFPQSVTPVMRTHLDAQAAFVNELSKSLFRSFQQACELNLQLAQTLFEEAARTQPATDKLRDYQQRVARLASDTQVELARVADQHVQATARTARAVVDDLAHTSADQAERGVRSGEEALRSMSEPFVPPDGAGKPAGKTH